VDFFFFFFFFFLISSYLRRRRAKNPHFIHQKKNIGDTGLRPSAAH
jgi:hypothetical protein